MSNATLVSTVVNGDAVQFACPTDESLMTALRDRVGLTGVKEGVVPVTAAHAVSLLTGS